MKDIKVVLENRPGALADMGKALGKADVNIEGMCGPCGGNGVAHVLVDDAITARVALGEVGIKAQEGRDVLVVKVPDKPGVLGEICRRLGDAEVNIDFFYAATDTRVVLGIDDLDKAKSVA